MRSRSWLSRKELLVLIGLAAGFSQSFSFQSKLFGARVQRSSRLHESDGNRGDVTLFDRVVRNRFACKKFKRYDGKDSTPEIASCADPQTVKLALEALNVSRLAPSSFNTQPYKVLLVTSPERKFLLSKGCLGPNIQRVLDSDCTAVILADRAVIRSMSKFRSFLQTTSQRPYERSALRLMQFYIMIFSSSYPLPRFLSVPLSFLVRATMGIANIFTSRLLRYTLPSLGNGETWATKNAMLFGMTFMLACTSRGLATIPMEGINAGIIRKNLKIPGRYTIPMIVSAGKSASDEPGFHSVDLRRYPAEEIIFQDFYGNTA